MTLLYETSRKPAPSAEPASVSPAAGAVAYASPFYARSLAEFGDPLPLPECGGWLLERAVPGSSRRDAMGCYPLFSCCDWTKLDDDLDRAGKQLVTVALVVDPFSPLARNELETCFDRVIPFKEHFIVDLDLPSERHVTRHHRYYARKSLNTAKVHAVTDPARHLDEWVGLYANLIARHQLRGIKAFSRESFRRQLEVPGLVMFTAVQEERTIGAQLWYIQGNVAYSHLTAVNDEGYGCRATYGIYWTAIETFKQCFAGKVRWLDLGAGAGLGCGQNDGLAEFKRGWSSGTRPAFFCGRIFDPPTYAELSRAVLADPAGYFPAYRQGEFA